jgi:hypothetical protein
MMLLGDQMTTATAPDYERDLHEWLMSSAYLMRQRSFDEIDAEQIAEELEAMGKRERRELISRLTILLAHLLKWQYQPARRTKSWRNTLAIQRSELSDLLEDSPSLRFELEHSIDRAYERAKLIAEDETGLEAEIFPQECPYALEEIIDLQFLPSTPDKI